METWKPYEKLVVVTFKIEPTLLAKLNELTFKTRRSRSEIIREAIITYMAKHEDTKEPN
ncbi:MAG: CopG family ribbon-helix-helix protein [Acidilobaceae archaeon]|jgi:metal-responsive CopG/Arc/MetJ family transcriptional regulator|nr:ribbon-helix-helix domain-containing protein [Desulfurococcaceae archaeon]MCC6060976.1 ribbon-helix-helix domain-containing protein [Desulfurococcaceae archaeon]MDT7866582.1 ribbon-helix-helix domain-containing protein [Desulfurococcales archaeon]